MKVSIFIDTYIHSAYFGALAYKRPHKKKKINALTKHLFYKSCNLYVDIKT